MHERNVTYCVSLDSTPTFLKMNEALDIVYRIIITPASMETDFDICL
jgi:hypothetical protein